MNSNKVRQIILNALILLRSAALIFAFLYAGKWLQISFGLPVSGSIIGLLLLFFTLIIGITKLEHILPTGKLLLQYLVLFFVPVGVGLLSYTDLLSQHWLAIVVSSVASTVIVLIVIGWLFQRLSR